MKDGELKMIEGKNMEASKEQNELKGFDQQIQDQKEKLSSLEKERDESIATGKGRPEKEIDKDMRDVGARIDSLYKQKAEQEKKGSMIRRKK